MQKEKCIEKSNFYHKLFPKVKNLSSFELHEKLKKTNGMTNNTNTNQENEDKNSSFSSSIGKGVILIDVRTKEERKVSTIPNSISISDFERNHKEYLNQSNIGIDVVTFCTIGFRSCLEARRLSYEYNLKGHIYSLDGILPYLYSSIERNGERVHFNNENGDDDDIELPALIQPETNEKTNRIHTFGPQWDISHDEFDSTHYKPLSLTFHSIRIGLLTIIRNIQYAFYQAKNICR